MTVAGREGHMVFCKSYSCVDSSKMNIEEFTMILMFRLRLQEQLLLNICLDQKALAADKRKVLGDL